MQCLNCHNQLNENRIETERTCMITLFSLLYDEGQTAFSKNYGYLISTEYWLTFYKYYIVFSNCLYRFPVSCYRLCQEKKTEEIKPGGCACKFEWSLEMKQYSKASGHRVFTLHMLFWVPIWRPFWKCETSQLVWFPSEVWSPYAPRLRILLEN